LRGIDPEPVVLIHPKRAEELGLKEGDQVSIETQTGKIVQRISIDGEIDPRVAGVAYGWWFPEKGSQWDESNVNVIIDDRKPYGRELGTPNLRGLTCKIYKTSS
jgi:anaerobic selenocysteine-containing dehydrogenase